MELESNHLGIKYRFFRSVVAAKKLGSVYKDVKVTADPLVVRNYVSILLKDNYLSFYIYQYIEYNYRKILVDYLLMGKTKEDIIDYYQINEKIFNYYYRQCLSCFKKLFLERV